MVKANVENVSVCMTIKNGGPKAERLVSVETSLAEKVELIDIQISAG